MYSYELRTCLSRVEKASPIKTDTGPSKKSLIKPKRTPFFKIESHGKQAISLEIKITDKQSKAHLIIQD